MIEFEVHGIPAPQGSKVRNRFGGVRDDNPKTKPWRAAIAAEAAQAMMRTSDWTIGEFNSSPVELEVTFFFPRPKSHFRTGKNAGKLKDSAPTRCATKPDLDKLLRAVGDGITGIIVRDDSQIVRVVASKLYGPACARVIVRVAL